MSKFLESIGNSVDRATKQKVKKFYPCIMNPKTGNISLKVSHQVMTYEEAANFLSIHQKDKLKHCEACPQPVGHPAFEDDK